MCSPSIGHLGGLRDDLDLALRGPLGDGVQFAGRPSGRLRRVRVTSAPTPRPVPAVAEEKLLSMRTFFKTALTCVISTAWPFAVAGVRRPRPTSTSSSEWFGGHLREEGEAIHRHYCRRLVLEVLARLEPVRDLALGEVQRDPVGGHEQAADDHNEDQQYPRGVRASARCPHFPGHAPCRAGPPPA